MQMFAIDHYIHHWPSYIWNVHLKFTIAGIPGQVSVLYSTFVIVADALIICMQHHLLDSDTFCVRTSSQASKLHYFQKSAQWVTEV